MVLRCVKSCKSIILSAVAKAMAKATAKAMTNVMYVYYRDIQRQNNSSIRIFMINSFPLSKKETSGQGKLSRPDRSSKLDNSEKRKEEKKV